MLIYVFKALDSEGSDVKMTPMSKPMQVRVTAEDQESALEFAQQAVLDYLGEGFTVEFQFTEEILPE